MSKYYAMGPSTRVKASDPFTGRWKTDRPTDHGAGRCAKVPHEGDGYLHREDDDSPYDVDGVLYCGRCHRCIDSVALGDGAP